MDTRLVARCLALVKMTRTYLIVTAITTLLSVLVLVWEVQTIIENAECRVCVLDGTAFVIIPIMMFLSAFNIVMALIGRGEAKFLSNALKKDDLEKVVGWNRVRMALGLLSPVLLMISFLMVQILVFNGEG